MIYKQPTHIKYHFLVIFSLWIFVILLFNFLKMKDSPQIDYDLSAEYVSIKSSLVLL